ncbi:hypothetical protein CMO88_00740 [Candidatus Woesearchaeota archaeon]|nr:hypothetical protein [Candidatus Woesearchaeota archaeon]|tara:strand:- start:5294 stop:5899 length:606 start_codon:yes stop_codon:yes gene_type:complete
MKSDNSLRKLEGLHTAETATERLGISRQSALNMLSKLKKEGYVTVSGGGRRKRLYKITMRKQRPREKGMFDIINKYSPMKIAEWYDHQVHGTYGPEEALVDALQTNSFRVILASMRLFSHITDWSKLYRLAKEKDCWQKVGALYDVARLSFKIKRMPRRYYHNGHGRWRKLSQLKKKNFPQISEKWHVYIPFNQKDLEEMR